MTKPLTVIHNVTTGEIIEREMTADEIAQAQVDKEQFQARKQEEAEIEAKRAATLAKLAALGLDEDDLKALGL